MSEKTGKERILETINDLDVLLMQRKTFFDTHKGKQVPEEQREEYIFFINKTTQLIVLRNRLSTYLLDTYGIFVFNGLES